MLLVTYIQQKSLFFQFSQQHLLNFLFWIELNENYINPYKK
jgi:hypothetical protein